MAYRLLVVAGTNEALQALHGQLGEDITITTVASANDALWEVRSAPPQAIIADVDLPDMSGLDMAGILPNFGVSTRVVLWSRTENSEAQQQASDHGVHRFLSGPLSIEDLRAEIYSVFSDLPEEEPEPEEPPAPPPPVRPSVPESEPETPIIERIVRPPTAAERTEQAPPPPIERPARRIIPNPDPPYQPPDRAPRRTTPVSRPTTRPTSGLASRARQAQTIQPPTPPPPPAPDPPPPHQRRAGTLILTADNLTPVHRILSDLSQVLGAQCALLTDLAGMVMAQHGSTHNLPMMILLPLLSTSFSTAGEVARQLHEEDATTLYMHDGNRYGLYCFDIVQRFLLVIVFDKNIATAKLGSVWVEARGAIRKLRDTLS